jgi:hypothetical protein
VSVQQVVLWCVCVCVCVWLLVEGPKGGVSGQKVVLWCLCVRII